MCLNLISVVSLILLLRLSIVDISCNMGIFFSLVVLLYVERSSVAKDFFFFFYGAEMDKQNFLRSFAGKKIYLDI